MSKLTWRDGLLLVILEVVKIACIIILVRVDWTAPEFFNTGVVLLPVAGVACAILIQIGVIEDGNKQYYIKGR